MRIALFGGSFDPPHLGHAGIALAATERLGLDRVLMAPVGRQPLKAGQHPSPYEDRLAMVTLLCEGRPPLQPSTIDAPLPPAADGKPQFNYTSDTLARLRRELGTEDGLFCLIGADSLQTLRRWHHATDALMAAEWIVAARPGFPLDTLASLLPADVSTSLIEAGRAVERIRLNSADGRTSMLSVLPHLHYDISATALRRALADHASGVEQAVLDPKVAEYARSHALYAPLHPVTTPAAGVIP